MINELGQPLTAKGFIPHDEAFPNWDEMQTLADEIRDGTTMTDNYHNGPFHRFYGWDFTELLWCWNMPTKDDDSDIEQVRFIITKCHEGHYVGWKRCQSFFERKATKDMRRYIRKMAQPEVSGGYAPFWRGLSLVKDDFVFLQMLYPVIGYAWT